MKSLLIVLTTALAACGQVRLGEVLEPGLVFRNDLSMTLSGTMKLEKPGGFDSVLLEAKGQHRYYERLLGADKTLRHYLEAASATTVGPDRGERRLDDKHRLIITARGAETEPVSRTAMTRDDLSLVAEHFDAFGVPGLLPDRVVTPNETWPIRDEVVKGLCLFTSLTKNSLTGKLIENNGRTIAFNVDGIAEGLENGSFAKLTITARGTFDLRTQRITKLEWEQADDRGPGPVSPAMEAKVKVTLVRSLVTEEVPELSAAKLDEIEPRNIKHIPARELEYRHPSGKFTLHHHRDWHAVVQTDNYLVLRLVKNGQMVAQATISPWPAANLKAGREERLKSFFEATEKTPGWTMEKILANQTVPTPKTQEIHRYVCLGKQDGVAVRQSFLLITNHDGAQAIINYVIRYEIPDAPPEHDALLAAGLNFPAAK